MIEKEGAGITKTNQCISVMFGHFSNGDQHWKILQSFGEELWENETVGLLTNVINNVDPRHGLRVVSLFADKRGKTHGVVSFIVKNDAVEQKGQTRDIFRCGCSFVSGRVA